MVGVIAIVLAVFGCGLAIMPQIRHASTAANVALAEGISRQRVVLGPSPGVWEPVTPPTPIAALLPPTPTWLDPVCMSLGGSLLLASAGIGLTMARHASPRPA
jgi:hypothetical protein